MSSPGRCECCFSPHFLAHQEDFLLFFFAHELSERLYAQDQEGNTSLPVVETLNVISPLSRKAVLVAGVDGTGQFTQNIQTQTDYALSALTGQGYTDSSVKYLSASTVAITGVDHAASKESLEFALTTWAAEATSDLVVYLVGDIINGHYRVSATESLSLTELDQWLDQVQTKVKGTLTIIHEGNYAGNLVAQLSTPANASRIVISSSALDQGSYVMGGGDLSFSRYFWNKVAQGGNVADAFAAGEASMRRYQTPQINSNGNAVSNEKDDRYQARFHNLGTGILLAADEPVIGNVPPNTTLSGNAHNTLWVDGVGSLSSLKKVWAVIEPPGYDPASQQTGRLTDIPLQNIGGGRWQADFAGFNRAGVYAVHYYAMDANNRISPPRTSYVTQTRGADAYEDDGSFNTARYLSSTTGKQQWHNFHQQDDVDYIRFEADPSQGQYTLKVDSQGSPVDAAFSLYDANHNPIALGIGNQYTIDGWPGDSAELASWLPASKGSYYLKVSPADQGSTGITGGYTISVFPTNAPQNALVQGVVKNEAGSPVVGASVYSSSNHQTTTDANGHYSLLLKQGENSLTVEASGYENTTLQLTVRAEDSLTQDFALLLVSGNNKPESVVSENATGSIGTEGGNRIQDMYIAYYGRPADPTGLEYWVKDLRVHNNLHTVLSSFGRSSEYTDRFGHYSDTELVNAIYQRLFNRDAEPEGLDYWVGTLRNGSSSLVEIALKIVDGAQNADRQIIVNKREVANAYTQHTRNGSLPLGLESVDAARALLDGVDETIVSVSSSLGRMRQ